MTVQIYKILNGMDPEYLSSLFSTPASPYDLNDNDELIQPLKPTTTLPFKTNVGMHANMCVMP